MGYADTDPMVSWHETPSRTLPKRPLATPEVYSGLPLRFALERLRRSRKASLAETLRLARFEGR